MPASFLEGLRESGVDTRSQIEGNHDNASSGDDDNHSDDNSQGSSSLSGASYASTSTRQTGYQSKQSADESQAMIADKLANAVSRLRALVVLMLLVTAAVVVSMTYIFLSGNEEDEFEKSVGYDRSL